MEYYELYVRRIRQLCKRNDWSINTLATISGVKQSTLNNIMHGQTQGPRIMTLHKLAIAFSMTLSEFLDFDEIKDYSFDE
ncbi:MAG: helix-turn-helix transcriptional regulator [Ruminococcaceae bacterium]|nr:helix-turn-helix transcriptional regulator [Oscillospiraceae bacterium]